MIRCFALRRVNTNMQIRRLSVRESAAIATGPEVFSGRPLRGRDASNDFVPDDVRASDPAESRNGAAAHLGTGPPGGGARGRLGPRAGHAPIGSPDVHPYRECHARRVTEWNAV
jgi:hypothetical protein